MQDFSFVIKEQVQVILQIENNDNYNDNYGDCHDKDTSPLRTSTHNLKPPSPVLTRVTTIVRVNQNKRPTDQNKKSGDPSPSKQSWGTIPNSEYSFDRGENPSPRRKSNR
ncbi:hypothetical protein ABEB36_000234 [Hypothenemus hampei]|uniref:Uncharacterized protein n=1 Tax=Hypothenemus hampei TaxID=57062 RepID=A0ABD1FAL2_HYPHA